MKPPLISILMSTRDEHPSFLKSAVESIIGQTYKNWEFLILDDGSKSFDNFQWLKSQAELDNRIKVFRGNGVGLARALNELLEKAKGEYFARMDSDDWSYPARLEKEMNYLVRHPGTVLVGSWIRIVDNSGKTIHFSCKPDYINPPWSRAAHSSWCGITGALRKIHGYSPHFPVSQDYDCWLRLSKQGRVGIVEEVLLDYRWGRISSTYSVEQIKYFWIANQINQQVEKGLKPDVAKIEGLFKKKHIWYGRKFQSETMAQLGMRLWQQNKPVSALGKYAKSIFIFPFNIGAWVYFFSILILLRYPSNIINLFRVRLFLRRLVFVNTAIQEKAVTVLGRVTQEKSDKMALIIPTINREKLLRRLLKSLEKQDVHFEQIIIVDAGNISPDVFRSEFPGLKIDYFKSRTSSLTLQRNIGINMLKNDVTLVCFFDDDIVVEKDAFKIMLEFWQDNSDEVGGVAFNIKNMVLKKTAVIKEVFLTGNNEQGKVMRSGYGSMLSPVRNDIFTDWIFGGATVWRRKILDEFKFDEWFGGYGFGEDLDFSYRVGKKYKLAVISQAKVQHLKEDDSLMNNYLFGKMQVVNRYYFVLKNEELSRVLYCLSSFGQASENLYLGLRSKKNRKMYLDRFLGNLSGFAYISFNQLRKR